jgi:hypothetical protein
MSERTTKEQTDGLLGSAASGEVTNKSTPRILVWFSAGAASAVAAKLALSGPRAGGRAMAAGQASVEGPRDLISRQSAREAERASRWADELEAALAASASAPAVPRETKKTE